MGKFASTTSRLERVYEKVKAPNCKAEVYLEYWNGTAWVKIEDIDEAKGIDWEDNSIISKYAGFSLLPEASKISFEVVNLNGRYNYGSGYPQADLFKMDMPVRLSGGYIFEEEAVLNQVALDLADADLNDYYYTSYSGGIVLDQAAGDVVPSQFKDRFDTFGTVKYSDRPNYTPNGYAIHTRDFIGNRYSKVTQIQVTANSTSGQVYYRSVPNLDDADAVWNESGHWTYAGATVNGLATFNISCNKRYFQVAIVFDGTYWGAGDVVTDISIQYINCLEIVYRNIFLLDEPSYDDPKAPAIPTVSITGRDAFKKAIETEINIPSLTGGVAVDDLIKSVCDQLGIDYSSTSIADLSAFTARTLATGLGKVEKAINVFEYCMQILNQSGKTKYALYMQYDEDADEKLLFVQPRPNAYNADFVFNYQNYESISEKTRSRDKLLKRITVLSAAGSINEEVQLATQTYTTTGNKTITWTGAAQYKRYTVSITSGTPVVTLGTGRVESQAIYFTIAATGSFSVTITVYGCKWDSAPTRQGEDINHTNMVANVGFTAELKNPLLLSNEAELIARGFMEQFGLPEWEVKNLRWPYLNLIPEINNSGMVWSRWLFLQDLFFITGIIYHWDRAENPAESTSFRLGDSGLDFSDEGGIIYDRTEQPVRGNPVEYNVGFVYDMSEGPTGTEADFPLSKYSHNLDIT